MPPVRFGSRQRFAPPLGALALLAVNGMLGAGCGRMGTADAAELTLPDQATVERFDFAQQGIEGWKTIDGRWVVEEMRETPTGGRVLIQRAVANPFNVIVAPGGPYTDVDVSVRFKPIAGREDASGGIVFRFPEARYYVVRANALEDNFALYYYDRGRRQLATAKVQPSALDQASVARHGRRR